MSEQTRIEFVPGYDHRDDPRKGAHGLSVRFVLIEDGVAMTWDLSLGVMRHPITRFAGPVWDMPRPLPRDDNPGVDGGATQGMYPNAGAVAIHRLPGTGPDWYPEAPCDLLPGGRCAADAGYLVGEEVYVALVERGNEGVWDQLRQIRAAWTAPPVPVGSPGKEGGE